MGNYWDNKYSGGGNSGKGSYGKYAEYKAKIINYYIEKYNIKTISDLGCGDGHQMSLISGYEKYVGYDISPHILSVCEKKFNKNKKISFCSEMSDLPEADLCLSLDVIYHLVDDDDYEYYMSNLFNKSKKYVLIFSTNQDENDHRLKHFIYHRKFTDWVDEHTGFKLIEETYSEMKISARFFLYEK